MDESKRTTAHFDEEIFLNSEGVYYYRGTPEGLKTRKEISLKIKKGALQKDVIAAKEQALARLEKKGAAKGSDDFKAVSALYLQDRLAEAENPDHLSMRTYEESKMIITNHFAKHFKKTKIVDMADQKSFEAYCKVKTKEDLLLKNHRKVMNHFLKWCLHNKYLKYAVNVEIPKWARKKHRERVVLDEDQIKRLLEVSEGKMLLYVLMYLFMGMRNMEICKLRWDEIDFKAKSLYINKMNNRRRKARSIPINSYVLKLLEARRKEIDSEWVFPARIKAAKSPYWNPYGGVRHSWLETIKKAKLGVEVTPHDLRSTFETFMHMNPNFTDTQREHMAGAKIDVQKDIYVKLRAKQVLGLEESIQIEGIDEIINEKTTKITGGKGGGKQQSKGAATKASNRKQGNNRP